MKFARFLPILAVSCGLTMVNPLLAQSGTSSAFTGTVADQFGAVIRGARVTATEVNKGTERSALTSDEGRYLFAQIDPGTWRITVAAAGFAIVQSQPTAAGVGQTATVSFTLYPEHSSEVVQVTAQSPLMALENPNTTTTIAAKTITSLPNPGQDLTYLAQFAQGALMNTRGPPTTPKPQVVMAMSSSTVSRRRRTGTSSTATTRTIPSSD